MSINIDLQEREIQHSVPESSFPGVQPAHSGGVLITEDHIRLLEIQPGNPEDPIRATIFSTRLSKSPQYEALSYTWGTTERQQRMQITSQSASGNRRLSIPVTLNCYSAVKRLRCGIVKPRTVWVDSICINQEDISERNHQLTLMTRIYSNATCVIVYLGESADCSDEAMDWIKQIDVPSDKTTLRPAKSDFGLLPKLRSLFQSKSESNAIDGGMEADHSEPQCETVYIPPDRTAMQALFNRPYFSRVWVLQELHMARQAVVYCGDRSVRWDSFVAFKHWNVSMKTIETLPYIIAAKQDRYAYYTAPEALIAALCDTRSCHSTDPRDKLYAILPLLQQMNGKDSKSFAKAYNFIKLDYHLTTTQVFTNVAIYLLDTFGLRFLDTVSGPSALPRLPSWVPDWSMGPTARIRSRREDYSWIWSTEHNRSKRNRCKVLETETDNGELVHQLQVKGRYVGAIVSTGDECDLFNDRFPLTEWLAAVPDLQALDESYHNFKTARMVIWDLVSSRNGSWNDVLHVIEERIRVYHEGAEARASFIEQMGREPTNDGTTLRDFIECGFFSSIFQVMQDVFKSCDGRRLFLTDTNYVGLGSMHCQVGDCTYMIEGAPNYYILRPSTGIDEQIGRKEKGRPRGTARKMRFVSGCSFTGSYQSPAVKLAAAEKLIIW